MTSPVLPQCIAFAGSERIASGDLATVVRASHHLAGNALPLLIFDAATSHVIDVDFRGTPDEAVARLGVLASAALPLDSPRADGSAADSPYRDDTHARGRGRPRLGVIAREVTLLPRHWDWLAGQPGGASAAVRRLVDEARQTHAAKDRRRQAQEAAYRFMSAMAGNEPGFEEATRALFAGDAPRFGELTAEWPGDVRDHARALAARVFA
ncbi:MAG TPA: DUF2239 family protein [Gemmatimonadaceae bacterium]|jgi:hypothetical protein|nr:DUF2239 family protein [Gemmatimonadaceae bacterium]